MLRFGLKENWGSELIQANTGGIGGKRVVILLGDFVANGATRQAYLLSRELRQNWGLHVEVWSLWVGESSKVFEAAGIPTKVLEFRRPQCPVRLIRFCYWAARLSALTAQFRTDRIDILLPFGSWANVVAGLTYRFAGIPVCIWGERSFRRVSGERFASKQYKHFVANSSAGVDYLVNRLGIHRDNISTVHNAVEPPEEIARTDWRVRLGLTRDQALVTMVAGIDRARDHATLLQAWRIVQNSWPEAGKPMLALAGSPGDSESECRKLIRKLGLAHSVRLLGPVDDVPSLLQSTDLVVFSSRHEGMPNSILEAMVQAKGVVATNIPGIQDVLAAQDADMLVPLGDCDSFARKIVAILRDRERRQRVGAANRVRALTEFRPEIAARRYLDVIQHFISPVQETESRPAGCRWAMCARNRAAALNRIKTCNPGHSIRRCKMSGWLEATITRIARH